jgi:hypothetical protein
MSAELNLAKTQLRNAVNKAGRKADDRLDDLCKAVENVIKHLEKLEMAK